MTDWQEAIVWLSVLSLFTFAGSLMALPWVVAKIPQDYFIDERRSPTPWRLQQPGLRLLVLILKNMLGALLLTGGILMLFLPGQGILTIAMGLLVMDYPGKYKFERWLVRQPSILRGLNWLRRRRRCPPLIVETRKA